MAEKDFREKRLEDFDDVFADIINVLLFNGEHRVNENDLESGMPRSGYKVEDECDYKFKQIFQPARYDERARRCAYVYLIV